MSTQPLEFPIGKLTKEIPCSQCGRKVTVSERTVMVFCASCSAEMGKKK